MKPALRILDRCGGVVLLLLFVPLHAWMQGRVDQSDPVAVVLGMGSHVPVGQIVFVLGFLAVRLLVFLLLPAVLAATLARTLARRFLPAPPPAPQSRVD